MFCLVKQEMCDQDLSQPALLVWPGAERDQVRQFWQSAAQSRGVKFDVDADRAADLLELADGLSSYPQYGRAITFLKGLAGQHGRPRYNAHPLRWIEAGGAHANPLPRNLPPRPMREPAHPVQVRFHRG